MQKSAGAGIADPDTQSAERDRAQEEGNDVKSFLLRFKHVGQHDNGVDQQDRDKDQLSPEEHSPADRIRDDTHQDQVYGYLKSLLA